MRPPGNPASDNLNLHGSAAPLTVVSDQDEEEKWPHVYLKIHREAREIAQR